MQFDEIFEYVGHFRIYQILLIMILGIVSFVGATQAVSMNVLAPNVDHWCAVTRLANFTFEQQRYIAIPYEKTQDGGQKYSNCHQFDYDFSNLTDGELFQWNRTAFNLTATKPCTRWTFDQSAFVSTAVSKYGLVCDRALLVPLVGSVYIAGMLVGSVFSGPLSDRIGRKKCVVGLSWFYLVFAIVNAVSPNYTVFIVTKFFISVFLISMGLSSFVIFMEVVGPSWRAQIGVSYQIFWSFGIMVLAVQGYAVREFTKLCLAIALPSLVMLSFICLIPESMRWLITRGQYESAAARLRKVAAVNRRSLPDDLKLEEKDNTEEKVSIRSSILDILKSRVMLARTLIIYLIWVTSTLLYYGISMNVSQLSGNVFLNTFLSGAVEVPANLICALCLPRLGRRPTISAGLIFAGVMLFGTVPLLYRRDLGNVLTALSMLGKAGVTVAFSGTWVWSSEIFPTVVRNVGMGSASTIARLFGIAAPFVGGPLRKVWLPLPSLIFGALALGSGILALLLPETLNHPMPETVKESEGIGRNPKGKGRRYYHVSADFNNYSYDNEVYKIQTDHL